MSNNISKYDLLDISQKDEIESIFIEHNFDAVNHFVGLKAVGEIVQKSLLYYHNNVLSTIGLVELCVKYKVNKFIFSSSATIYGDNISPLKESMELRPTTNPYDKNKVMSELILIDTAKANKDFSVTIFRYFNPVGAHESGLIGEDPNGIPNNLMPYVTRVA